MLLLEVVYRCLRWILVDLPDPRLDDALLLDSIWYTLFAMALYACWISWMPEVMKERRPFKLEAVMTLYNVVQVVLCGYVTFVLVRVVAKTGHSLFCEPIDYGVNENTQVLIGIGKLYYYLKILDMVDTIFNVLRKKKVSFLHAFHHGGMVAAAYIGVRYVCGGMTLWIALINSFVHTVMYFYYLLCIYSKVYRTSVWWKKHLTQLQLVQFLIYMVLFGQVFVNNTCGFPRALALTVVTMTGVLVLLFSDFYYKAYIVRPGKSKVDNGVEKEQG